MPRIFIIMALILIAGAFGLWYTWDDGDGGTSTRRGRGGVQAKAILLINPQAFAAESPEAMDRIVRSYAEKLNEPGTIRRVLSSPLMQSIPPKLLNAVRASPRRYVSSAPTAGASFVEISIRGCGSADQAERLARAVAKAFILLQPAGSTGEPSPIILNRVVRTD